MLFILSCLAVRSRFVSLNKHFNSEILKHKNTKFQLKIIARLYYDLCDAIKAINESLTNNLIPIIIYLLVVSILVIYSLLRMIVDQCLFDFGTFAINLIWLAYTASLKLIFAYVGNSMTSEAESIYELVGNVINENDWNDRIQGELKIFLRQIRCRNTKIQNGFFVINWSMITAVSK